MYMYFAVPCRVYIKMDMAYAPVNYVPAFISQKHDHFLLQSTATAAAAGAAIANDDAAMVKMFEFVQSKVV